MATLLAPALRGQDYPPEINTLNARREAKIQEINAVYLAELAKAQLKFTKSGDLKSANLIQTLIDKFAPQESERKQEPSKPGTVAELQAYLIGTSWSAKESLPERGFVFQGNGEFKDHRFTTKYVVTGMRTVDIYWGGPNALKCLFSEDYTTMTELGGNRHVYKFLGRIK